MASVNSPKLVILDRDGVINFDSDDYIKSESEWNIIPNSADAIGRLCKAGFQVAVATNQSGLARGFFSEQVLFKMHTKMTDEIERAGGQLSTIKYCPHLPEDQCNCRKPKIGLLTQISEQLALPLSGVPFIGDSLSDIKAAIAGGCTPMLVLTGKGRRTLESQDPLLDSVQQFDDLAQAVDALLYQYANKPKPTR